MERLLFLAHRIPFPPNKGDKIRAFNLLKQLSNVYSIWLGAFVDDPSDWRHASELRKIVNSLYLIDIRPGWRKLGSLLGLLKGEALSLPYYRNRLMLRWVTETIQKEKIERIIVYSSPMAQYVLAPPFQGLHRVTDFVDVDSEKWRQYGQRRRWPLSWLYTREAVALLNFERRVAAECDASVFSTREEADLFRKLAPESANRVVDIHNGVDTQYFSPELDLPNPYEGRERVLVFTGAMDYWANVDAITWFARAIFPQIRRRVPQASLYIVGAHPTAAVRRLHSEANGIKVTGAVKDIRPFLAHARAAVAPLRVARGVQNKVLEAMAMAKPVLATSDAMVGIQYDARFLPLVTDSPHSMIEQAVALLNSCDSSKLGSLGRELVMQRYSWAKNLSYFEQLLRQGLASTAITSGVRRRTDIRPTPNSIPRKEIS